MVRNAVGREIPERIADYPRPIVAFGTAAPRRDRPLQSSSASGDKRLATIEAAIDACELRDGATVSFHHHLRDGDAVLNLVVDAMARRGLRDLTLAASSLFPVHAPLVEHLRTGVITAIETAYIAGPVGEAVADGLLARPARMLTHGGRARAIEAGETVIDAFFLAAPAADRFGNVNGIDGPNACGVLGYALVDARFARRVVAITDHLLPHPLPSAQITQEQVDHVVVIDRIGESDGLASGTTQVTESAEGLAIADQAVDVISAAGALVDGLSFQTGAGGISLAVATALERRMLDRGIAGSFASGGITGPLVELFEAGLFASLLDVQCFDLAAVDSFRRHGAHREISASLYANPDTCGPVVDQLDVVVLGAAEVDVDFNLNVTTGSDGRILGGSGGHADTAAGASLAIVTTRLNARAGRKVRERVATVTTPGRDIDVVVTDEGIAVNPARADLADRLRQASLPVVPIERLAELSARATGGDTLPAVDPPTAERIAAVVEYRDGSVIDVVRTRTTEAPDIPRRSSTR